MEFYFLKILSLRADVWLVLVSNKFLVFGAILFRQCKDGSSLLFTFRNYLA